MYRTVVMVGLSIALVAGTSPDLSTAQTKCPEVESAKQAYATKLGALKLKDEDIRASRSLAGVRSPEAPRSEQQAPRSVQQAPRSEQQAPRSVQQAPRSEQQAPRSVQQAPRSEQQAPRSEQQAPRSEQQAPRSEQQAPRHTRQDAPRAGLGKAKALIADADAACQAGKTADAAKKANEALRLLK